MKIFAFIFARGGSKEIKNKNIKIFAGQPLLNHTINFAKKLNFVDKIYVSSDSKKIRNIAKKNNVLTLVRPKKYSKDKSAEWLAWRHAIKHLNKNKTFFDIMIILPCTAPLRNSLDIYKCLKKLNKKTDIVVTKTTSSRHPAFNMVKADKFGKLKPYINLKKIFFTRQELPKIYNLCTIAYVTRPKYILNKKHLFDGVIKSIDIPESRSIDIDTKFDFKVAEYLFKNKNYQ